MIGKLVEFGKRIILQKEICVSLIKYTKYKFKVWQELIVQ